MADNGENLEGEEHGSQIMTLESLLSQMLIENNRRDRLINRLLDQQTHPINSNPGNASNYNIMPDLSKSIGYFDGENKVKAREWINNIKSMKILHNWPEAFVLETARTHFVGAAKFWLSNKLHLLTSFPVFEHAFMKTFVGDENITEKWRKMETRVQCREESIQRYFHEKVKLCQDLMLNFDEIREQVLIGLFDKTLCDVVSGRDHRDEDDLLHSLEEYFRINERRKSRFNTQNNQNTERRPPSKFFTPETTQQTGASGSSNGAKPKFLPPRDDKDQPLCFTCRKYGHISKYCRNNNPNNRTTNSNQNSYQNQRPSYQNQGTLSQNQRSSNLNRSTSEPSTNNNSGNSICVLQSKNHHDIRNNKYFQEILINNKKIKSYIDFGSQGNLIKKSIANELQLNIEKMDKPMILRGFGDGQCCVEEQSHVKIEVDQAKADTTIYLVPDDILDIPLLLGQPFTEQDHIVAVKRGNTLRIFEENSTEKDDCLDKFDVPELPKPKINLWCTEKSVIPAKFVGFIEVCINENVQELFIDHKNQKNRVIPRCIVKINEKNQTKIPMVNITDQDLIIEKNEKIARAEECHQIDEITINKINEVKINKPEHDDIKLEDINLNSNIEHQVKLKLLNTLNEFKNSYAKNQNELGCTTYGQCIIETLNDKPVTYRPYRLSHHEREKVSNMVNELKEAGIIVDSNSSYASPVLIVKKKTGDERLCIDYRGLNKVTKKMEFPLPLIEDQLDRLSNKKYFTTLDLMSGYYQVPVDEKSREKTAFVTNDGLYEFTKMPFGLINGPAIFSKMMNKVLGPLRFTIALAYMDDILIPSSTEEEGIENLRDILIVLQQADLKLNLKKCYFLQEQIDYLGFEISNGQIKPGTRKLKSVMEFPIPAEIKNVRQFLGLTGYFRKFVHQYAVKVRPLTKLLCKDEKWYWGVDQQTAFEKLKQELTSSNVLKLFDSKLYTEVHTDASIKGLGAILLQKSDGGKMHPVVYLSRQTTYAEQQYHSSELETLCVTWALEKLRCYLIGIKFTVVSDCNALRSTFTKKNLISRIGRWYLKLLDYDYEVKHRPGTNMEHVDALSRNPINESEETDCGDGLQILFNQLDESDWLCLLQLKDPKIKRISEVLIKQRPQNKEEQMIKENYEIVDGRVFRKLNGKLLWCVPKQARWRMVKKCHDDMGHLAVEKTLNKIQQNYWFPRMRNYLKGYIGTCIECLYYKVPGGPKHGYLHPIDKIGEPFHTIHLDHLGPFVKSKKGNMHILVIIDGFTKFVWLKPVKKTTSSSTVKILEEIFHLIGKPFRIISDRGTAFTGKLFEEMCKKNNIKHVLNATATPRANGQCERINRVITPALASLCELEDGRDWDNFLLKIQWTINNTVHQTTKFTPYRLVFNLIPRDPHQDKIDDELNQNSEDPKSIQTKRKEALNNIQADQKKQMVRFNKKRCAPLKFQSGDLVMLRKEADATGSSRKLLPKYKGPYIVVQVLPNDRYVIEDIPDIQRTQKFYNGIAAVDSLKKYDIMGQDDYEDSDDDENHEDEEESIGEDVNFVNENEDPDGLVDEIGEHVIEKKQPEEEKKNEQRPKRSKKLPKYLEDYQLSEDRKNGQDDRM